MYVLQLRNLVLQISSLFIYLHKSAQRVGLTEFIIQVSFVLMDLLPNHLFTAADIESRAPLFVAGSPTSYARSGIMLGHTSRYPGKPMGV